MPLAPALPGPALFLCSFSLREVLALAFSLLCFCFHPRSFRLTCEPASPAFPWRPLRTSALNRGGLTSVLETRRSRRCCLLLRLHLAPEINAVRVRARPPPGEPARPREAPHTREALSRRAQRRAGPATAPCSGHCRPPVPAPAPSSSAPRTSASSSQRGLPLPRSLPAPPPPPPLLFSEL